MTLGGIILCVGAFVLVVDGHPILGILCLAVLILR